MPLSSLCDNQPESVQGNICLTRENSNFARVAHLSCGKNWKIAFKILVGIDAISTD